ncbi:TetR/AcrR family transcriptional regulator [Gordonia sp. CPCC 205333]|uniref:TetR/AcrR family transcriptional regulator n=1 Tax=Gordonia sp. CPCC 205333 TaxID=3140790 RepID=UPI003AF3C82C
MASVRERLIDSTVELVRRHGVAGAGVAEIVKNSNVARRSLYWNFPGGKAELVAEATRFAGDQTTAILREVVDSDDPLGVFIEIWKQLVRESEFEGGCAVSAAAFGRRDAPEASDVAAGIYAAWTTILADRFSRVEGMSAATAEELAATVVATLEGALLVSRAAQSTEPLDRAANQLRLLIGANRQREEAE